MELHVEGLNQKEYPGKSPVQLVEMLEAKSLRLFHKEVTVHSFCPTVLMHLLLRSTTSTLTCALSSLSSSRAGRSGMLGKEISVPSHEQKGVFIP